MRYNVFQLKAAYRREAHLINKVEQSLYRWKYRMPERLAELKDYRREVIDQIEPPKKKYEEAYQLHWKWALKQPGPYDLERLKELTRQSVWESVYKEMSRECD